MVRAVLAYAEAHTTEASVNGVEQAGDGEGVGEDGVAEKTWWILLLLGFMGYC